VAEIVDDDYRAALDQATAGVAAASAQADVQLGRRSYARSPGFDCMPKPVSFRAIVRHPFLTVLLWGDLQMSTIKPTTFDNSAIPAAAGS
jgi:hypothetical protein